MSFPVTTTPITQLSTCLKDGIKVNIETDKDNDGSYVKYLKFYHKTGEYSLGKDAEDVTDTEIIINTETMAHGWLIWDNGTAHKYLCSVFKEAVAQPDPVGGNHALPARSFSAVIEDEEETIVSFETSSLGGRKGFDALLNAIRAKSLAGETEFLYPIVRLSSTSYKSKAGGTIYNCMFPVIGWVNRGGKKQEEEKTEVETEEVQPDVKRRRKRILA